MKIIKLNVGGKIIMSYKNILFKIPLVKKLLTTELSTEKDDNGNIFIDRDPHLFEKILNDVRNERKIIVDDIIMEDECKYYGVEHNKKNIYHLNLINKSDEELRNTIIIFEKEATKLFNEIIENKLGVEEYLSKVGISSEAYEIDQKLYRICLDSFEGAEKVIILNVFNLPEINKKLRESIILVYS